jgi:hypothetical protein
VRSRLGRGMELPRANDNGASPAAAEWHNDLAGRIGTARNTIRRLERKAYSGAYTLSGFILLSIGATLNFSFLPSFSPAIRKSMGMPPPTDLISIALIVYVFSAVILSLSRMMEGSEKIGGLTHLGYLGAFFFFYHFRGDMDAHFWAVFAAGATIISLESYQLWNFCRDEILKEREVLEGLEKRALREGIVIDSHGKA